MLIYVSIFSASSWIAPNYSCVAFINMEEIKRSHNMHGDVKQYNYDITGRISLPYIGKKSLY
jgi:hypothetical protein